MSAKFPRWGGGSRTFFSSKSMTFVIGKMKLVSFSLFLDALPP